METKETTGQTGTLGASPVTEAPKPPEAPAQQGGAQAGAGGADLAQRVAELEAAITTRETDINRLKSAADRRLYDQEQTWKTREREWQEKMNTVATAGMDEGERSAYESEMARQRLEQLQHENTSLQQQMALQQQTQAYLQWLHELGIDSSKVDLSNPPLVGQMAAEAITREMRGLRDEVTRLKSTPPPQPPTPPVAPLEPGKGPTVVTGAGSGVAPSTKVTFEDLREVVSKQLGRRASDFDVFDAHRRKQIDLNQLAV